MFNKFTSLLHPEIFQGSGKKHSYFEGWYFKVLNATETHAYAFIPGIAIDADGNKQAFIQALDGKKRLSNYHKFDFNDFHADQNTFKINIAGNHFSSEGFSIDLPDIKGTLNFKNLTPWPSPWYSPGIMGPFSFVPFMECKHGIVSMDHEVFGQLRIKDKTVNFDGGRGYTEKDWGKSFPEAYTWMQSNQFSSPGISLKASVAKIPWMGRSFIGFIAGLWLHDRLIRFTTYNLSSLHKLSIDSSKIELTLANNQYRLEIKALRDQATSLASPIRGFMDGHIEESMSSEIEINLTDKRTGQTVLQDTGRNAAIEVAGNRNKYN